MKYIPKLHGIQEANLANAGRSLRLVHAVQKLDKSLLLTHTIASYIK